MFKTTHFLIPIAVCFIQLSYWSGSCTFTTAKLENITTLSKVETSNSSPDDNPTTTTTVITQRSGHSPTEAKMITASIVTENEYHKVYSPKKSSIPQAGTTEGGKSTEPDPTITTKKTGGIIGISREAADIITSVVVIYIALVVTLVALRLCSSRVLKMQNNQKQKMQKSLSERKCEINIEEIKGQDGTKQTDEIIEISGDSINVTTTNEDVILDSLLKETAEKHLGGENKNEGLDEQNCSKIDENASDTITEKKFWEESTDRMNLLNKSKDDEDENALSEIPVSCEREESFAPLEDIDILGNKNKTNTIDVSFEEDTFPPPPTPTSEVSDMLTQCSAAAPMDQSVFTILTTAMLKNNKDTTEKDEVTVESTDL